MTAREVRRDDVTIAYDVRGEGPPVLLVQGAGVPGSGWQPQVDGLADRYELAWFDNRGIGGTKLTAGKLTIEALAGDALAVMDALGFESAHVAGHSMGGLIAQAIAIAAPERVRSLALLCTFRTGSQGASLGWWMFWKALRMRVGPRRARRRAALELVFDDRDLAAVDDLDAFAESLRDIYQRDLADQPEHVMKHVSAMRAYDPSPGQAALSDIATLVLSGTTDRIATPEYGRDLHEAIAGSRFCTLDGAHAVTITRADEVNELLHAHWSGVSAGRAGSPSG